MLLGYGAKNFFCFKEGIEISLRLGGNCPNSITKGKNIATLLCIKGANAAGKTNALKIISFIKYFCSDSFSYKPEEDLKVDSYFFNDGPIDLFCDFELNNIEYRYEASLTNLKIISETFFRKKKKMTEIFRREANEIKYCIKEFDDLKRIKLRSNASIISTAHQYDTSSVAPIYRFFNLITTNVTWSGRIDIPHDYHKTSEYYHHDPELFMFAKNIIRKCDLGIRDIKISSTKNEKGVEVFSPVFEHETSLEKNKLLYFSQSSGTKALYNSLPYYKYILEAGSVLIMDEFDINFHPHILPILIGIFDDKKLNKDNAQMLFTTHNTDIMDLVGKYRIVLINQKESESYGYRLDEISGDLLRNDRPITPVYRSGKLGGVPRI